MKKHLPLLAALLCLLLAFASAAQADGGIVVDKKDLSANETLDKNVTNIVFLFKDGDVTDTMLLASINSQTGRAVMTSLDCAAVVSVPGAGEARLADVYAMGDEASKSGGPLIEKTLNEWLSLNIGTYIVLDVAQLPAIVDAVGTITLDISAREREALGIEGSELGGEETLAYIRLKLEDDEPGTSRAYHALMQLLYQGVKGGDMMSMLSMGTKLLSSVDSNLNPLTAVTLVTAVMSGEDRRELHLPQAEQILTQDPLTVDAQALRERLFAEVYE